MINSKGTIYSCVQMSEMKAFHMDKGFYGAAQLILPASTLQGLDCTFKWVVFKKKTRAVNPFPSIFLAIASQRTAKKIYVFPEMKLRAASFPIFTFMYLWAIYIFPGSVYLFFCSK